MLRSCWPPSTSKLLSDTSEFESAESVKKIVALSLQGVDGLDQKPTLRVWLLELAIKMSNPQADTRRWRCLGNPIGGSETLPCRQELLPCELTVAAQANMKRPNSNWNRQANVPDSSCLCIEVAHAAVTG
jgi:hypothetical protein